MIIGSANECVTGDGEPDEERVGDAGLGDQTNRPSSITAGRGDGLCNTSGPRVVALHGRFIIMTKIVSVPYVRDEHEGTDTILVII